MPRPGTKFAAALVAHSARPSRSFLRCACDVEPTVCCQVRALATAETLYHQVAKSFATHHSITREVVSVLLNRGSFIISLTSPPFSPSPFSPRATGKDNHALGRAETMDPWPGVLNHGFFVARLRTGPVMASLPHASLARNDVSAILIPAQQLIIDEGRRPWQSGGPGGADLIFIEKYTTIDH